MAVKRKPKKSVKSKRNYRKEYDNYHSSEKQKKNRTSRNAARRKAKKSGKNVAGKDVTHKDGNPRNNKASNLGVASKSKNRSYARTKSARKKNPRS